MSTDDSPTKSSSELAPGAATSTGSTKGKAAKAALARIDQASAVAILAQVPAEDVWLESLDSELSLIHI